MRVPVDFKIMERVVININFTKIEKHHHIYNNPVTIAANLAKMEAIEREHKARAHGRPNLQESDGFKVLPPSIEGEEELQSIEQSFISNEVTVEAFKPS